MMTTRLFTRSRRVIAGFCVLLVPCAVLAETSLLKQQQSQQRIGNSTADSAALLAELVDELLRRVHTLEAGDYGVRPGVRAAPHS